MKEHEKLSKVIGKSQVIGEFLDWVSSQNIVLSKYEPIYEGSSIEQLFPIKENTENLLAKYFDIDLKKLEEEKLEILNSIRQ